MGSLMNRMSCVVRRALPPSPPPSLPPPAPPLPPRPPPRPQLPLPLLLLPVLLPLLWELFSVLYVVTPTVGGGGVGDDFFYALTEILQLDLVVEDGGCNGGGTSQILPEILGDS